jgi:hypothetical protein
VTAGSRRAMDEIELELARTRVGLADTAAALTAELAPRRIAEKGVNMIDGLLHRSGAIGLGSVRADPAALALIGLGVAWLIAENTGIFDGHSQPAAENTPPAAGEPGAVDTASQGGNGWLHQAGDAAQGVLEEVSEWIGGAAHAGGARVRQAGERFVEGVERSPLLLGLAGLAAGAAVAMLLPASRREREIAARARDDLWDKAEALGHRAANAMREMAEHPPRQMPDC